MLNQLQLHRRDRSTCALVDGPLAIGWIRMGIIGFGGYEDRREAMAAGIAAASIVTRWASRRRAPELTEFPQSVPEADAIRTGAVVIGRVLAPEEVQVDLAGHGFELAVPADTWVAVMLEVAQRIHHGVRRTALDERLGALAVPA